LDGLADAGALVSGDVCFVEVEPVVPMVDEDLPKAVAAVSGLWVEKLDRQCSQSSTIDSGARDKPDNVLCLCSEFQ
jgi:hypothetical protein